MNQINHRKKLFYSLVFCFFLGTSCSNDTNQHNQCYHMKVGSAITAIQLTQEQDKVYGYYAWEPKEQDGGYGSFTGTITKNQINAYFTYIIEGDIQTQEIAFKKEKNTLIQGQGELIERADGTLELKSRNQLEWTEHFTKTSCKKIQTSINNAIQAQQTIKK